MIGAKRIVRYFALIIFISALLSPLPVRASPNGSEHGESRAAGADPYALVAAVNDLRAANGFPPLNVHPILMQTAQAQADYMASTGSVTHTGPGGTSVTQRLLAAGYPLAGDLSQGGYRSENIIAGPNMTVGEAVQAWTGDAPHLNTMLSPNYQDIGAGAAVNGDVVYYVIDCAQPTGSGLAQPYTPLPGDSAAAVPTLAPVMVNTPLADGAIIHVVQSGETLWTIALAYGVTIEGLRLSNNLLPGALIYPGNQLTIRRAQTATPEGPTATATTRPTRTPFPIAAATATSAPTATLVKVVLVPKTTGSVVAVSIIVLALGLAGAATALSSRKPVE